MTNLARLGRAKGDGGDTVSHARGYGVLLLRQNEVKFLTYLRALRLITCWRIGGNEVLEFKKICKEKVKKE